MRVKHSIAGVSIFAASSALNLAGQQGAPVVVQAMQGQPVARPLTAMPYSPSLDVESMDRAVDPCVDFYKFSCGGWKVTHNPIPADQAAWSVYAKLANDNQQFLWGILAQDAQAQDRTPVQQKVGDYFAACMNTDAIDALGDKPVQAEFAKIDGLKTRAELIAALTELHHEWLGSYFFGSGTGQDAADSSVMIVEVGAGGLGLPDRDYYTKTDDKSVKIRAQYAEYIEKLMGLEGKTAEQAKADADAILRIETVLAKASLTRVERRDPHNVYHMKTVEELETLTPSINWVEYFKAQGAPGVTKQNVSQPEFMKAVEVELATEDVAALRAYLRFHLLTAAAPYMAHNFEQANFDFFSKTLRGVPAMPPRWKTWCEVWIAILEKRLGKSLCGGRLPRRPRGKRS